MQTTRHSLTTSLGALLFTACMFLGFASNAYGMQICQMTDTLVWELEKGFDISPADIDEYSEAYDVVSMTAYFTIGKPLKAVKKL